MTEATVGGPSRAWAMLLLEEFRDSETFVGRHVNVSGGFPALWVRGRAGRES